GSFLSLRLLEFFRPFSLRLEVFYRLRDWSGLVASIIPRFSFGDCGLSNLPRYLVAAGSTTPTHSLLLRRLLRIWWERSMLRDAGNGRAFCAGGDVAVVARDAGKGNWRFGANFFHTEYKLNYLMATYSKPQVSILNGIVMGGGAGASVHGRFRIVTENTIYEDGDLWAELVQILGKEKLPSLYEVFSIVRDEDLIINHP
ncbi:3-hydroxyisobutyryl-CoA hydrolase 1, partial [Mucuna pruriens]